MIKNYLIAIRPKTLSASLAPILLSQVFAYHYAAQFSPLLAIIILACALCLQISVNLANDYFDDKNGIDNAERLGPKRAIQAGLLSIKQVKQAMWLSLIAACLFGLILIVEGGLVYLILGLLSVAGVFAYSAGPKPLASHALGEVAVFIFFGPMAVMAAFYLQVAGDIQTGFLIELLNYSSQMGLLAAAIMLVNNIRDQASDGAAGKTTLAILLGQQLSKLVYCFILFSVITAAALNDQAIWQLVAGTLFASILSALIFKRRTHQLNQQLAQTAGFMLLWSLLSALDFIFTLSL